MPASAWKESSLGVGHFQAKDHLLKSGSLSLSIEHIPVGLSFLIHGGFVFDPLDIFFNDTATTEIYPLPLHDALPISCKKSLCRSLFVACGAVDLSGEKKSA